MKNYSYEKIYEIMTFMAKVVSRYGEVYLPIFERLQDELGKAEQRQKSLDLAKNMSLDDAG